MSDTLVMVGTRKGLWIGRSDEARRDWSWTGPHFPMEEVYSCMIDTRGAVGAAAARGSQLELARTAGLAVRRPRRDLAGDAERCRPLPRGHRRRRRPRLAARPRCRRRRGVRRDRARRDLPVERPRRDLRARARTLGQPAARGVERRLRRPGLPHDPAAPGGAGEGARGHLDRRRLPHRRRGRVVVPVQRRRQGGVLPGRAHLSGVRPVRAQGDPAPGAARAALPAEPRRGVPLRGRRRQLAGHRARAPVGVRLPDRGAPARPRDRLRVPDHRRRRPLAGRRARPRLALGGSRRALGGARRRRLARLTTTSR